MENINPIGELMQATMDNVKNMLKVDTVVGDPIYTPDGITLIPISRVSVGFGGGGVEFTGKKIGGDRNGPDAGVGFRKTDRLILFNSLINRQRADVKIHVLPCKSRHFSGPQAALEHDPQE